ncbi:MAG: DUF1015 family protein [Acidimicrobiia bacterium]
MIADGHHRYETSLAYRDERRADGGGDGGDAFGIIDPPQQVHDVVGLEATHRCIVDLEQ